MLAGGTGPAPRRGGEQPGSGCCGATAARGAIGHRENAGEKANGLLLHSGSTQGSVPLPLGAGGAGRGLHLCHPVSPGLSPMLIPKNSCTPRPALHTFPPLAQAAFPLAGLIAQGWLPAGKRQGRGRCSARRATRGIGVGCARGQLNPTSQGSTLLSEGRRWLRASMAAGGSPLARLGPPPPQPAPRCQPRYLPILAESGWGPFSPPGRSIPDDRR